jgi:hypothetical protein
MSNLNPGGSRNPGGRIFGAANIKRTIQTHKPDHTVASGSIADRPHQASREQQRRLKQQQRKAK